MSENKKAAGTLYLVPTPIGNLEDITYRAINILHSVSLIGAEDTRKSGILLSRYNIKTPVLSYHKFNEKSRLSKFIGTLSRGEDVAVITDAGTPGISDPASIIINSAIENNISVSALPGATALIPALVSSGIDCRRFVFIGFLPSKMKDRRELLTRVGNYPETLIFYEAGSRLFRFLSTLKEYFGNRYISIGREISKRYETYYRAEIGYFLDNEDIINIKGEFTIVCEGYIPRDVSDEEIIDSLKKYLSGDSSISSAVTRTVKELQTAKNRTYKLALKIKKGQGSSIDI